MALLYDITFPEGVTREFLQEITTEMNVRDEPIAGCVLHLVTERDGRLGVVDVWDSGDAYEQFAEGRLRPAMAAVAARHGLDINDFPEAEQRVSPAYDVILGRVPSSA